MKLSRYYVVLFCLCLLFCLGFGCHFTQPTYHAGGPYYYRSWKGGRIPVQPKGELTIKEAEFIQENGYPYYEAHFNKDGYISSFKKISSGKTEWEEKYYYEDGIFKKREIKESGGKKTIELYDQEGNIVEK